MASLVAAKPLRAPTILLEGSRLIGALANPSDRVARQLNERPREALQFETPALRFSNSCCLATVSLPAVDSAKVETASNLTVRINRNAHPYMYAARIPVVAQDISARIGAASELWLRAQIKVTGRGAGIGVLSSDEQSFLAYQAVEATEGFVNLGIPISGTLLGPVIITNGPVGASETVVELRDARIVSAPNKIRGIMQGLVEPPQP